MQLSSETGGQFNQALMCWPFKWSMHFVYVFHKALLPQGHWGHGPAHKQLAEVELSDWICLSFRQGKSPITWQFTI